MGFGCAAAAIAIGAFTLSVVGFGSTGIIGGSIAAGI